MILCSAVQSEPERLRQNSDPVVIILGWQLSLNLGFDVEARHQPREEKEQLHFCQSFAKTLTFADGEWDEVIVLLARACFWIKEPFRPEHLPVAPVGALEHLHHERHDEGAGGDGHSVHNHVVAAAMVYPVGNDVCISLDLHQDSFSVEELWFFQERGRQSKANNCIQLILNLLLHLGIASHEQERPCECGRGSLRAGEEKVIEL